MPRAYIYIHNKLESTQHTHSDSVNTVIYVHDAHAYEDCFT